ncbi:alpha/beta hydrolase [Steroidobacter sp. S1-65]|uniref:Alpha/beta hydrolase n=1 Tax=Steroidobacter gossypii TaxID=2805490 RepID=A0ABS1WTG3_9GAMM|nr:alpha/beta hydrolase [Steroidobacter gossypii]MBM0104268.1 alpha/beta hydrolase [Steroidobacter gossypii]
MNRVAFDSDGIELIGDLYIPKNGRAGQRRPAIVIVGSLTSVKEQMSGLYARRLAEQGFVTLAFDYRNFGESGGEPRQYESPRQHVADIRNAVSFLSTHATVDPGRIAGLGICTGGAYMAVATATESRIKAFAAVASHLASEQTNLMLYGGESGVAARRQAGRRAMSRYRSDGHVEYLLAYSNKPGDATASHSGPMEYYFDASRGYILPWTNRFAVMSWEEWLDFDALSAAPNIRVPSLVIHGDNSALPGNAKTFFEKLGTEAKQLVWSNEPHFDFYDRDASKRAAEAVAKHFHQALASEPRT